MGTFCMRKQKLTYCLLYAVFCEQDENLIMFRVNETVKMDNN